MKADTDYYDEPIKWAALRVKPAHAAKRTTLPYIGPVLHCRVVVLSFVELDGLRRRVCWRGVLIEDRPGKTGQGVVIFIINHLLLQHETDSCRDTKR